MDYIELNLLEMLDAYGENKLQSILSHFMCPPNKCDNLLSPSVAQPLRTAWQSPLASDGICPD